MPSKCSRKPKVSRATGNVSLDQLVRASSLVPGHGALDRAAERLGEAVGECGDQVAAMGVLGGERLDRIAPGATGVLGVVPREEADLGEERFDLVLGHQLPVEVAGVPVDQHPAEVEDHCRDGRCVVGHFGAPAVCA
jgi:hypothetical protein